jgi:aspartate/methionine/tyrosine aminotransferase
MRAFGTTVFAEMSELAAQTGALNLGQGFPDTDGPDAMLDAAVEALRRGPTSTAPDRATQARAWRSPITSASGGGWTTTLRAGCW